MPECGSQKQIIKVEELRIMRATWNGSDDNQESGASTMFIVVDKDKWIIEGKLSVLETRRHVFEAELTGCWMSIKTVEAMLENNNPILKNLEDVILSESKVT